MQTRTSVKNSLKSALPNRSTAHCDSRPNSSPNSARSSNSRRPTKPNAQVAIPRLKRQLEGLKQQEDRLLDLAADGEMPTTRVRERLQKVAKERMDLEHELQRVQDGVQIGVDVLLIAQELLENAQHLYDQADDATRRVMNQAIFTKILIYGERPYEGVLSAVFADITAWHSERALARRDTKTGALPEPCLNGSGFE